MPKQVLAPKAVLAIGTAENFMAGLEALNQAMVMDDGESVAA